MNLTARTCGILILTVIGVVVSGCVPKQVVTSVNVQIQDQFEYSETVGELNDPSLWLLYTVKAPKDEISTIFGDEDRFALRYHLRGEMTIWRGEDVLYNGPFFISSITKPFVGVKGKRVFEKRTTERGSASAMILLTDLPNFTNGTVIHVDARITASAGDAYLESIKLQIRDRGAGHRDESEASATRVPWPWESARLR